MLFIGFSVMGYISYKKLPVELFPNVELPLLIVQVSSTNEVDPKYMESQAIIPLESVISTLENFKQKEVEMLTGRFVFVLLDNIEGSLLDKMDLGKEDLWGAKISREGLHFQPTPRRASP